jgi:magnesium and cobalt transporter
MNDDQPPRSQRSPKRWVSKITQFLRSNIHNQHQLLEKLKEAREQNLLDTEGLSMMEGVLHVAQMQVRDIMIPRIKMVVVPKQAELESIYPLVIDSSHSRFPVIEEDRSQVVGILMAKDLLAHIVDNKQCTVEKIMRPANMVPESKRLNILLREFRTERNHMAIVVDEYGMAAGLVTIEDVLEQIVGEIEDEHDVDNHTDFIVQRNPSEYVLKGLTPLTDFNSYFSANLDDNEFDTISGFIVHKLQYLPKKGDKLLVDQFRFEVLHADSRRLHLIKLKLKSKKPV